MRRVVVLVLVLLFGLHGVAEAGKKKGTWKPKTVHVRAHVTKNGTYVPEHMRSRPSK